MKLGKLPARPGAVKFALADYVPAVPAAPAVFGHQGLVRSWRTLGNDRYGDCVWAGAAHETMLWTRATEVANANFTDAAVLSDYAAATGFNPYDPNSDQGTDMQEAASYRRRTGVVDSRGHRHTILAYLAVHGTVEHLASAAWLFGAVGVGIEFPDTAMGQFDRREPWDAVPGARIEGGHYVPLVGRRANGNFLVVTWGRLQEVTPRFLFQYVDETVAYVTAEWVRGTGTTLDGFNLGQLTADLKALA